MCITIQETLVLYQFSLRNKNMRNFFATLLALSIFVLPIVAQENVEIPECFNFATKTLQFSDMQDELQGFQFQLDDSLVEVSWVQYVNRVTGLTPVASTQSIIIYNGLLIIDNDDGLLIYTLSTMQLCKITGAHLLP